MPCAESDDECWGEFLEENPPCDECDDECWESFLDYFSEDDFDYEDNKKGGNGAYFFVSKKDYCPSYDFIKGKGDAPPCGEQDWDCIDKWAAENEDKLPCKLKDDDKCWWDFLEANPPCKEEDEACKKSFKRHYLEGKGGDDLPAPEGPPCGEQDFECWKKWGSENPEKLPCKIDGSDDECWEKVLKEDPPCKEDDEDCWKHFVEVFGDEE